MWAVVKPTFKAKSGGLEDGLLWWHDPARCQDGDLSISVVQANNFLEDQFFVESALSLGTVIGVFDGHGGPEASYFIHDHLLTHLREAASGPQGMTPDAIRKAFLATEQGFISLVSDQWETRPSLAVVGSCCLVGIVQHRTLFIANLGDSRAVLGKVSPNGDLVAEQLCREHNVSDEGIRQELIAEHPDDPQIVLLKHNVWRVRGIIQVSRSIGDAYLKYAQYNKEPLHEKFRLHTPFSKPLLSANPDIVSHCIQPSDHFVIFASDGLWEFLTNQEAVEIVQKHRRKGIARRLVEAALHGAVRKYEMRYSDLKKIDRGVRRHFHDDITVIVLFFNHAVQSLSIRCPIPRRNVAFGSSWSGT